MRILLFAITLLLLFTGCQKSNQEPISITGYTASYTVSSNVCDSDYGFRLKNSTGTLSEEYSPDPAAQVEELELVVNLCSAFPFNSLPQTIPAIIYRNGEVYLNIDLIRTADNSRRYVYSFHHYKM
jgi:hypothetical protein